MIFRKNHEFSKISNFSDSGSQDGIDPWELLEVGARPQGGEERAGRPRRAAQNVGRRPGAPRVSVIILSTCCKHPQATLIDPGGIFLKKLFLEESRVF